MGLSSGTLVPDTLRTIDSATFTGQYQIIGSALTYPTRILKIYNDASVAVTISWNGSTDHDYLPSKGFILLDVATNKQASFYCQVQGGTAIYVKAAAGTGSVYLTTFYTVPI